MQIHITNSVDPQFGGEGIAAKGLSVATSEFGIKVILISRSIVNFDNYQTNPNNMFSIIYLKKHFFLFQTIIDLFNIIHIFNIYKPKVVHIHGMWTVLLTIAAFICIFKKIKYIISPHGCMEPWALNHKKIKKQLAMKLYQRFILKKSSCLVVNSELEQINTKSLNFKVPIAIIKNAIPKMPLPFKKTDKKFKNLLFFSRIHHKKGVDKLLNAWTKCNTRYWTLKIVGPGELDYVQKLQRVIKKLKIKNVELRNGFVSDEIKKSLFKNADGFILPTRSENFGIVIIEALSFRLPVITTKEAPWEEISKFKCGWWVKFDTNEIASAVQQLIDAPKEDLENMGLRGYKLVKENYTWLSKGKQAHQLYCWLLKDKLKKPSFVFL